MSIIHDGIACRLPPRPLRVVIGLAAIGGGAWSLAAYSITIGVFAILFGALVLLNEWGVRKVKVIYSKLLVEDEHLLRMLLIGPARRRIAWSEVRGVHIDGGCLRLDTDGAPFITAQGASQEDLAALKKKIDEAWAAAKAGNVP